MMHMRNQLKSAKFSTLYANVNKTKHSVGIYTCMRLYACICTYIYEYAIAECNIDAEIRQKMKGLLLPVLITSERTSTSLSLANMARSYLESKFSFLNVTTSNSMFFIVHRKSVPKNLNLALKSALFAFLNQITSLIQNLLTPVFPLITPKF